MYVPQTHVFFLHEEAQSGPLTHLKGLKEQVIVKFEILTFFHPLCKFAAIIYNNEETR